MARMSIGPEGLSIRFYPPDEKTFDESVHTRVSPRAFLERPLRRLVLKRTGSGAQS